MVYSRKPFLSKVSESDMKIFFKLKHGVIRKIESSKTTENQYIMFNFLLEPTRGLEPRTLSLRMKCSTN